MNDFALLLLTLFFLFSCFCLTAFNYAFIEVNKRDAQKQVKTLGHTFFYRALHLWFFPTHEYEGLQFANSCALVLTRFGYAIFATLFMVYLHPSTVLGWAVFIFIFFTLFLLIGEFIPKIIAEAYPQQILQFSAFPSSLMLTLAFPWIYLLIRISQAIWKKDFWYYLSDLEQGSRQDIIDIIEEAEVDVESALSAHEKKLIESVVTFKNRIAREVMVPRVNIFALRADTSIREAARLSQEEGYSRIPVYRTNIDDIVGILMYKDILVKYMEFELENDPEIIEAPIESIMKSVFYTPETKKISNLLQEFRKKQMHIAIVVDEYGGTEGIVTIEDILEEIVGEISDEYDEEEETVVRQADGSWMVDARVSILDLEEQLGIKIPQEGDYETIGGYIFHHAGLIPQKGFVIKTDDFEIEIVRSNERRVEKVRIKSFRPLEE